jgi:hypothetical protein
VAPCVRVLILSSAEGRWKLSTVPDTVGELD